jgi:hypothetical protein
MRASPRRQSPQAESISGVTGCEGIRKTMKFGLVAGPAIIQVSGVSEPTIKIAIMPVTE